MSPAEQRIMRIPIPVPLIRDMDALILEGPGGYSTRAEFIVDAIQERLLELSVGVVEDAGAPLEPAPATDAAPETADPTTPLRTPPTLAATVLEPPVAGAAIDPDSDLSRPEGQPLLGLHNRDYPSLWALTKLAKNTQNGAIPAETFFNETLRQAWRFGEVLVAVEKHAGLKCTALFPTNEAKRKAAANRFRSFAIGTFQPSGDAWATSGPLFEWRLAGLIEGDESGPLIGMTGHGWQILQAVVGISVEEPHPACVTAKFLGHLAEHAPADERGFREIVAAIGPDGATRQGVHDHFARCWPDWSATEVATNSSGYVARAREWGLVEPKQAKGQYHLTALGHDYTNGGK